MTSCNTNNAAPSAAAPQVVCVERDRLSQEWLPESGAFPLGWDGFVACLNRARPVLVARQTAEIDTTLKQVIPYVLIADRQGRLACYQRRGAEKRLTGRWSIGIGGHVDAGDWHENRSDCGATVLQGMRRELAEELRGPLPERNEFLGVINEELSTVGQVHIGAVFSLQVADPTLIAPGPELNEFHWVAAGELQRHPWTSKLELWSLLALSLWCTRAA